VQVCTQPSRAWRRPRDARPGLGPPGALTGWTPVERAPGAAGPATEQIVIGGRLSGLGKCCALPKAGREARAPSWARNAPSPERPSIAFSLLGMGWTPEFTRPDHPRAAGVVAIPSQGDRPPRIISQDWLATLWSSCDRAVENVRWQPRSSQLPQGCQIVVRAFGFGSGPVPVLGRWREMAGPTGSGRGAIDSTCPCGGKSFGWCTGRCRNRSELGCRYT
jgi:hypothetical protein